MVKNLTIGNPAIVILYFTIPLFLGNVFQQSYNLADTVIVGRTIGMIALAAVGSTAGINFLILGFLNGFGIGASVLTAQRFGAGDIDGVRRSFATIIIISTICAIALTVISYIYARPLLELLRTPPEIIDSAYSYIIIIFLGIPTAMLFNMFANVMRAVGDSVTPLIFLAIACVLNISLDLIFILVFHTGLGGVAFATVISQLVSGLLCIPVIHFKIPVLKLTKKDWRIDLKEISSHLKLALPVGFQMSIIAIGTVTVSYAVNQLGTIAVAAFSAASRIDVTAYLILFSFGGAMTTFSAQNFGAGKTGRILQGIKSISIIACSYCVVVILIFIFTGDFFPSLFLRHESEEALSMASSFLVKNGSFYVLLALLFIIRQSLLGLGDSVTPTIAGAMELVMRVFAAIVLGGIFGWTGICYSNPLAWLGAMIPLTIAMIIRMRKLKLISQK